MKIFKEANRLLYNANPLREGRIEKRYAVGQDSDISEEYIWINGEFEASTSEIAKRFGADSSVEKFLETRDERNTYQVASD